jgi:hypothetical protein
MPAVQSTRPSAASWPVTRNVPPLNVNLPPTIDSTPATAKVPFVMVRPLRPIRSPDSEREPPEIVRFSSLVRLAIVVIKVLYTTAVPARSGTQT